MSDIEEIEANEEINIIDATKCVVCMESMGVSVEPLCDEKHRCCFACVSHLIKNECPICRASPFTKLFCLNCGCETDKIYKKFLCVLCYSEKLRKKYLLLKHQLKRCQGAVLLMKGIVNPEHCHCHDLAHILDLIPIVS